MEQFNAWRVLVISSGHYLSCLVAVLPFVLRRQLWKQDLDRNYGEHARTFGYI